ncbi:MAG: hypothetical protein KIT25_12250 [Enhydrobacter sp.]|nr:MAG: hypothetical protein KIT25_12250 [Enhydrobacter sp.]
MLAAGSLIVGQSFDAAAQAVEVRQWQGTNAQTRQSEHVVATNNAEWRGLWSRVGAAPPDHFEPGRMRAVGIFLGRRQGEGYLVNILSANRRRDRIVIVFEERVPAEALMAQRSSMAASRPVASSPGFAPGGAAGFAPSANATASLAPVPARPPAVVTSPWAIVLINRSDLPVSVEQRLLR